MKFRTLGQCLHGKEVKGDRQALRNIYCHSLSNKLIDLMAVDIKSG